MIEWWSAARSPWNTGKKDSAKSEITKSKGMAQKVMPFLFLIIRNFVFSNLFNFLEKNNLFSHQYRSLENVMNLHVF